ncbi:MAG: transcriptional regulator [Acidimicrobiaceae bacterium]|nr:transcriptional regulator [Acidimicrobiaceae bacterium]
MPDLDQVFRALANEGRRTMLDRLCAGPASLGELAEPLDMTLSAVEQHVRTLERCGLVRTEKRGRTRYCRLEPSTMSLAEQWIADRRTLWERRLDALGAVLDANTPPSEPPPEPPPEPPRREPA